MANELKIPLTENEVKVYYQSLLQKVTANDFNRLSGAESEHSAIPAVLSAILATIGRNTDTAIGFSVSTLDNQKIQVGAGLYIRPNAVYIFPPVTVSPNPGSLEGIYEIELEEALTDSSAVPLWNTTTQRFQPQVRPTRKTYRTSLFEQWVNSPGLPTPTTGRIGLLSFHKNGIGGPITNLNRILPVYDPGLIGVEVQLDPGIGDRTSIADAINWIFQHLESKDFIRTTSSPGFDNTKFQVRTQGNFAYWSKDGGGTWLPFA
ncbi:hypothetical protein JWG45_17435 [Leptospira sp. 201903070]|uniref:Uncharacterized protein n=1 Tax=Leptospira ainlahdjerensis TaxID=2810033 RepID=A0ABS2UEX3_9LEPT|nr:hypothetical protein [Leptospira ainlahdjerensis]MBM9578931.1 hypothetical protein [Leptospira ainlahdjerensis]